jgi:hypothetical protein
VGGLLGLLKSLSESLLYEIFVRCELNRSEVNICGKRTDVNLGDPELRGKGRGKGGGGGARKRREENDENQRVICWNFEWVNESTALPSDGDESSITDWPRIFFPRVRLRTSTLVSKQRVREAVNRQ